MTDLEKKAQEEKDAADKATKEAEDTRRTEAEKAEKEKGGVASESLKTLVADVARLKKHTGLDVSPNPNPTIPSPLPVPDSGKKKGGLWREVFEDFDSMLTGWLKE